MESRLQTHENPSGTLSTSNEFQGVGNALQGVATATYQKTQGAVTASNTTTTTVPLFVDDAHGWEGTRVTANVTNIKDTRDWVNGGSFNDAALDSFPVYRKSENTWYPLNGSYINGLDTATEIYPTHHVISNDSYRAIRLHFAYVNVLNLDFIRIYTMDDRVLMQIAGANSSTNFWTPWFEYAQIKIGYHSSANGNGPNLYFIDYYEYVPIEETIIVSPKLETPHPYAISTNYTCVLNSSRSAPFMRAHFSLLDVETTYDFVDLLSNTSTRYYRYDQGSFTRLYSTDLWTPWAITNRITFTLRSDVSNVYNGYIIDKYQLSSYGTADFDAHAVRVSDRPIYWNHYLANHPLGYDNLTVTAPAGCIYMRLNFTYASFQDGDDYLVLYDNQSRWLMDYTGHHFNFVTPWFRTNSIKLSYLSDGVGYTEELNLGAKIRWIEWMNATSLDLGTRVAGWTFSHDYDLVGGRASGYGGDRRGEVGLGVEIKGVNKTVAGEYGYKSFSYESKDRAEFYQVFPVPRGGVTNGYVKLDYFGQKLMASNDFELYIAINDSVIYTRSFGVIAQRLGTWQSTGAIWMPLWLNQTSLFGSINAASKLKLSVGMRFVNPSSVTYSYFANIDRQILFFDDVSLVLVTSANCTQPGIDLRANGTAMTGASASAWGQASFQLTGKWPSNPLNIAFTTASPAISFDVTMILSVRANVTSTWTQTFFSTGSSYSVQAGTNVSWSWYENVYIPSGYQSYMLNVSKPPTRIIDFVKDPTGTSVACVNGAEGTRWFAFSTSSPGWYRVEAHSRNYFDPVQLSGNNATWASNLSIANQQQAFISTPFRIPLSSPSGNGTFLLNTPAGGTWLSQPFIVAKTTNVTRGPFTFGPSNSTGGVYAGYSAWENGTEAGFRAFSITSTHSSRLEVSYPVDARIDNTTIQLVDSIVPVRIVYNDTFSSSLIPGATVTGALNCSPVRNFAFTESTPGIYDYALDTTGLPEGNYSLQVSAAKAGYSPGSRTILITITVDTRVDAFTSFQEVQHGFNASVIFHYHDVIRDVGVPGASIGVSFSGVDHSIADLGNGDYALSINTSTFGLGSRSFTITVQKPFHETVLLSGSLQVIRMATRVEIHNGTLAGYVGNPIEPYNVSFYHPDYPIALRFPGAAFSVYLDSSLTTKLSPLNYTVTDTGNGWYTLSILTGITTPLNTPGIKSLYIVAGNSSTSPFYLANSTAALSFILNARPVLTSVFLNDTNITSEASFSVGIQEDFQLNVTVKDLFSGSWTTSYAFVYNFSNGHSGTFSLQGSSYVALVNHDDLSGGYFTLRITGTSATHEALQVQYVVSVQVITTYVEAFINYQLREHGTNASINFHYHDAVHDTGIPGAMISVTVVGKGLLNPSLYTLVDGLNGDYAIRFNTTLLDLGSYAFYINSSKLYHQAQVMAGTIDVIPRLSSLQVLNTTISGYMADEIGPIAMKYYHPDLPETLNYTRATFTISTTPTFMNVIDPAGYTLTIDARGVFLLTLKTGPGTGFTTPGIKNIYVHAANSSTSAVHVANASTMMSFIISLRPIDASIYLNGANITGETSITASIGQSLVMNVTLRDLANGSIPLLSLNYVISSGPSGFFVLLNGNYSRDLMSGNFTTGVQVLSITSSSPIHAIFSRVFLITIIPRDFSLGIRVNGTLISTNGIKSILGGTTIELSANFTDVLTSSPLYSGRVNVTIDGMLVASFVVNSTSAAVVIDTSTLLPGFHGVTIFATMSNYSAGYMAFTLEITRRALDCNVVFDSFPWDGISPVEARLTSMVIINFTMVDVLTSAPVLSNVITFSPPTSIGVYSIQRNANNITLTFNSSALGIGKKYLSFVFSSPMYSTIVIGLVMDVLQIPITMAVARNQTYIEANPSGSLFISIFLAAESGQPVTGASVSYTWTGGFGTLADMHNGTYQGSLVMPVTEGMYSITIHAYFDGNHTVATSILSILVKRPQLSNEAIMTNTIFVAAILAIFFLLFFVLYLRPRIIKRRLVRFEDVKSCTVHKGPIKEGLTYVCPTCGSIYCTKCAQALFNNNDPCWSCATPIQPFAVSYQEDWRKNLQYLLIYQGGSPEPIYEQSLTTEEVLMPEMLKILKKSITRHVAKPTRKSNTIEVQEYFNSKILFGRGDFITLVLVTRIDSSFIHDKMNEFVENWELAFFDKDARTWKAEGRDKFSTKTRMMVDGMFVKEEVKAKDEPKKGKGKGKGEYVNPEDLVHKAARMEMDKPSDKAQAAHVEPKPRDAGEHPVAFIPVTSEIRPSPVESNRYEKLPRHSIVVQEGLKDLFPPAPPENVRDGTNSSPPGSRESSTISFKDTVDVQIDNDSRSELESEKGSKTSGKIPERKDENGGSGNQ